MVDTIITTFKCTVVHVQCVMTLLMDTVPRGDFPRNPCVDSGEQGSVRGEQGFESPSPVLSSTEDGWENCSGTQLPEMVRTRGEPQCSSHPLSTVLADF